MCISDRKTQKLRGNRAYFERFLKKYAQTPKPVHKRRSPCTNAEARAQTPKPMHGRRGATQRFMPTTAAKPRQPTPRVS